MKQERVLTPSGLKADQMSGKQHKAANAATACNLVAITNEILKTGVLCQPNPITQA